MITEDYVSFETAKLLKEKGFNERTNSYFTDNNEIAVGWFFSRYNRESTYLSAPTLQMAMKWLREEHKLFITIEIKGDPRKQDFLYFKWGVAKYCSAQINRIDNGLDRPEDYWIAPDEEDETYERACEAAIKYCLKNLIKNEDEEESDIPVPKTVDEAISTLEKILSDEDREYLLENGAISMHNSLGRWIRNEWGLWTDSELKNELMNMNKGLNHPDDMSNYIIEEFIKYWNNKL